MVQRIHNPVTGLGALWLGKAARRLGGLAALLALLIQILTPLIHCPMQIAQSGRFPAAGLMGAICRADAGQPRGNSERSDQSPLTPGKLSLCPICLALAAGGAFILPTVLGIALALLALIVLLRPVSLRIARPAHFAAYSRGPPLTARI